MCVHHRIFHIQPVFGTKRIKVFDNIKFMFHDVRFLMLSIHFIEQVQTSHHTAWSNTYIINHIPVCLFWKKTSINSEELFLLCSLDQESWESSQLSWLDKLSYVSFVSSIIIHPWSCIKPTKSLHQAFFTTVYTKEDKCVFEDQ